MSTENNNTDAGTLYDKVANPDANNQNANEPPAGGADAQAEIQKMVEAKVAEELKAIKSKLDNAYAQRDEYLKKATAFEEEKRQAEIKRMEEEGKHKEVYELKMAEHLAKLETLQKENTRLTRDQSIKDALAGSDFLNAAAADMAFNRVKEQLIQDEHGRWVHKTGVPIKDYVEHFKKDSEFGFLFKAKTNSGAGATQHSSTEAPPKPITQMTTQELLAHFAKQAPGPMF